MSALELIGSKPDVAGSMDKRLGILAITLSCYAPDLTTACLGEVPAIGISGLVEWQPRRFKRLEAGEHAGYDVEVTLEGHIDPDKADEEYFELEGSTSDAPIEAHWNFDVLLAKYGSNKKPDKQTGRMIWPQTLTGGDGQPGRNRMAGVDAWANPGLIWNRNWVASEMPASVIDDLGVIFETLPGNPKKLNNPPGVSGGRNWLCVRARGRQRGNIWQLSTSYQLSDPHGWVPEMYPHR